MAADGAEAVLALVLRFARALRAAGLAIGPARVVDAVAAVAEVGIGNRSDLFWALHAALVSRGDDRALFAEAFPHFWPEGDALPAGVELLLGRAPITEATRREVTRRLADVLPAEPRPPRPPAPPRPAEVEATIVEWSDRSTLRTKDFEQMTAAEIRESEAAIDAMTLPVPSVPTRRRRPDPRGDVLDARATLRAALRTGADAIPLRWRSTVDRPPELVALVDVSGSMARYARMLLRFLHALTRRRRHVSSFTFATRLTNVTRSLRHRDPDEALARIGALVTDWDGGTRIGSALREFNVRWSRRVLGQGAIVLLVTDGLDREDANGLAQETARLQRSCRRLLWLNPLLRYQRFEPRAAGVRAMLPHVDAFLPVHDLASIEQLTGALSETAGRASRHGASRRSEPGSRRRSRLATPLRSTGPPGRGSGRGRDP